MKKNEAIPARESGKIEEILTSFKDLFTQYIYTMFAITKWRRNLKKEGVINLDDSQLLGPLTFFAAGILMLVAAFGCLTNFLRDGKISNLKEALDEALNIESIGKIITIIIVYCVLLMIIKLFQRVEQKIIAADVEGIKELMIYTTAWSYSVFSVVVLFYGLFINGLSKSEKSGDVSFRPIALGLILLVFEFAAIFYPPWVLFVALKKLAPELSYKQKFCAVLVVIIFQYAVLILGEMPGIVSVLTNLDGFHGFPLGSNYNQPLQGRIHYVKADSATSALKFSIVINNAEKENLVLDGRQILVRLKNILDDGGLVEADVKPMVSGSKVDLIILHPDDPASLTFSLSANTNSSPNKRIATGRGDRIRLWLYFNEVLPSDIDSDDAKKASPIIVRMTTTVE